MSKRNFATRMSCFSLISAIETDIRNIISKNVSPNFKLPADVDQVAKERFFDDKKEQFNQSMELIELLDYVDFYDLSKILSVISKEQNTFDPTAINSIINGLQRLSKSRNRVCHSRPLEPDDLMNLLDFTDELLKVNSHDNWVTVIEAVRNLNNPSYIFSLEIPDFWKVQKRSIFNNLPLPEFDDTGFMGRKKDRDSINALLFSNTKVISIVGEGGIGKTALAQRCLYDVLEICESKDKEKVFDIIIWISLKTKKLTVTGIHQIHDAINSSSGLVSTVSNILSGNNDISAALEDLTEYMNEFKVLLCIDNLETITANEIRDFLANLPNHSKILITTRIGLGEIEYRYKLDKLDDNSSINLMRGMAKLLNLKSLIKSHNNDLKMICSRLFNNPLLIKWYVLGLASGKPATELLGKSSMSFKDALKFCFENLYDQLGPSELMVISIIACLRKQVSAVELRFLMDTTSEIEIEEALNQLHNSSMLESWSSSDSQMLRLYTLTDIAEEYLTSVRPVSKEIYQQVKLKNKELQEIIERDSVQKSHYQYDVNSIFWTTPDEKICSIYLNKALTEFRNGNTELSEKHIQTAKKLMPEFSECYRIHAHILKSSSPFKSENEHERSIEYNPNSSIARYAYSQFLLSEHEYERALEQIEAAILIDPVEISLLTFKAWILTLKGSYLDAISIYEKILPEQPKRLRKFRISSYDQAIECFRRLIEQLQNDHDYLSAGKYLNRAFEITSVAINSNDYDGRIIAKLCRLITLFETSYKNSDNNDLIAKAFDFIQSNLVKLNVAESNILKTGLEEFIKNSSEINANRAQQIIDKISKTSLNLGDGRLTGKVINVTDKGSGVSFGFISGQDGNSYFFHRGCLNPDTLLDNDSNFMVSFIPTKSAKGLCAIDIHKL